MGCVEKWYGGGGCRKIRGVRESGKTRENERGVLTIKVHTKNEGEGLFVACITSHPNNNYKMFSYHFL